MPKYRKYEDDDDFDDTVGWEMCDEISLANGFGCDYYEYWKHPAFIDEEADDE